jgi:hypothetical protein
MLDLTVMDGTESEPEDDHSGNQRDNAANERDVAGDERDVVAGHRDAAAEEWDAAAEQRDVDAKRYEQLAVPPISTDALNRSAAARGDAASDRDRALQDRWSVGRRERAR